MTTDSSDCADNSMSPTGREATVEFDTEWTDHRGVTRMARIIDQRPSGTTLRTERGEFPGVQYRMQWLDSSGLRRTAWTVTFPDEGQP